MVSRDILHYFVSVRKLIAAMQILAKEFNRSLAARDSGKQ
jgi:hypothetical protein